ncbi:MAG: putative glycine dehydrogenase (decarboxylating) subunit 1 [Gemmatimonadota bacterium]|nr:MAG: putative glycine dehydrogenase (decarboxylating) subunit 1 [Gemmatimonadota bacterium]
MSAFVQHSPEDRRLMLEAIGVDRFEDLVADIPAALRRREPLALPAGVSEPETIASLQRMAGRNRFAGDLVCFAGGGIYDVCVPVATAAIASRPEFSTSYTPYQAEVSQGTLQVIYEFQTVISRLTGLEIANASMYDAGTALAEAVLLALTARTGQRVLVSPHLHPHHRAVLKTFLEPVGVVAEELPAQGIRTDVSGLTPDRLEGVAAVVLQHPNFLGALEDMRLAGAALEGPDTPLFIASVDLSSLSLVEDPGSYGADIAVSDAQTLGIPMSFGGPVAGVFAARQEYLRRMPGRIAAMGRDAKGQRAFTLAFQTREQHIRRSKATSNICTNQALTALMATVSTALIGETGRRRAAELSAMKAHELAGRLAEIPGVALVDAEAPFFREFALRLPDGVSAAQVLEGLVGRGVLGGIPLASLPGGGEGLLVAVTEKRLAVDLDHYVDALQSVLAEATAVSGRPLEANAS